MRPQGQVLAEFVDYSLATRPADLRCIVHNTSHGRYPGTFLLRIEYEQRCSPWFEWLKPKFNDIRRICRETGWTVSRVMRVKEGSTHAIILRKPD